MATDRQIAANRENALKSTGPRTPEGRAAVRLNSLTHGLTAKTLVLPGESEEDFGSLLDSLAAEHDPITPTEQALVSPSSPWPLGAAPSLPSGSRLLRGPSRGDNLVSRRSARKPVWSAHSTRPSTNWSASAPNASNPKRRKKRKSKLGQLFTLSATIEH